MGLGIKRGKVRLLSLLSTYSFGFPSAAPATQVTQKVGKIKVQELFLASLDYTDPISKIKKAGVMTRAFNLKAEAGGFP